MFLVFGFRTFFFFGIGVVIVKLVVVDFLSSYSFLRPCLDKFVYKQLIGSITCIFSVWFQNFYFIFFQIGVAILSCNFLRLCLDKFYL